MPCLLLIFNLGVRNRGLAVGTPVNNSFAPVNKPLFVKAHENLFNRLAAPLVKGKALSFPVARGAHFFKLLYNSAAVLLFPFPGALQKAVSADVLLGKPLLPHFFNNFRLGRNRGVVGARHPQGIVPLHTLKADKYVLQRIVERVPHMELTRNIRGRNNYCVGRLIFLAFCVEVPAVKPHFINSVFNLFRVVLF